jgi:osmotically-inducible protein OsmY
MNFKLIKFLKYPITSIIVFAMLISASAYSIENSNSKLANEILTKINKQKKISLKHLSVIETEPGAITIEGIAEFYGEKYYAQKIAEESHATKINNKIIVKPALLRTDSDIEQDLFRKIKNELIDGYFDDVSFKVSNGIVTLYGKIKRIGLINKILEITIWTPGVRYVENNLTMLPLSKTDDDIRITILKKMRNDMRVAHYFVSSFPNIIILVERGHVTLKGYVNSNADKVILGQIANSIIGVHSVNNLLEISN